jgi:hypothetical protein
MNKVVKVESTRKAAERAYVANAFDYAKDPIGSRDWVLWWKAWQECLKTAQQGDGEAEAQRDMLIYQMRRVAATLMDSVVTHGTEGGWLEEEANALFAAIGEVESPFAPALSQPAAVEGWKLIDTAPEVKGDYFFCLVAWGDDEDKSTGYAVRFDGKWYAGAVFHAIGQRRRYFIKETEVTPTHWMEFPKFAAPTLPQSEDARGAERFYCNKCGAFPKQPNHEGCDYLASKVPTASGLLSEKVESGDMDYQQALINLLCRIHRDGGHYIEDHGLQKALDDADLKVAELNAASDAAQQALEMGFAEGVKAAAAMVQQTMNTKGPYAWHIEEAILALTPPTDTVTMTREEFLKVFIGLNVAKKFCGSFTADECSDLVAIPVNEAQAIVAQHTPKESK